MGRIKKAAGPKHDATLSPALSQFVSTAITLPLIRLPSHLHSFPAGWPFPRGDLYHWIPLLDHFDKILEDFVREYGLKNGPQIEPFQGKLLDSTSGKDEQKVSIIEDHQIFGEEGDRELIETILTFSRTLLENCGNRSLYNSSEHLGDLLNTTSLSLLSTTLRLAARLAQRYHASRQRGTNASQSLNNALLASHYNINLDRVQKLADPFVRAAPSVAQSLVSPSTVASSSKGKEKVVPDFGGQHKTKNLISGSDIFAAVKDETSLAGGSTTSGVSGTVYTEVCAEELMNFDDWADVWFTFYQSNSISEEEKEEATGATGAPSSIAPNTPTHIRRTSVPSRPSRLSSVDDSTTLTGAGPSKLEDLPSEGSTGGLKILSVQHSITKSTPVEDILQSNLPELPTESHYDFLNRIRVAKALTHSLSTRRQIFAIRILAITNLAYIYPEATFQQKILQQDSDEPRRLQLAYQLADLIHPPGNGKAGIPLGLKTIALGALEALSKHKGRASDICTALSVNVNHGVLLYIIRKTVADLAVEEVEREGTEGDEWREALFSLLESLPPSAARTAESLVGAGLFDVLVEVLALRTRKAERCHPKVLMFMNTIIYTVRDAFQTFANSKGLDIISDLIAWEVTTSLQLVKSGNGLPERYKSQVMDYDMPYFQQQTLRWLFKFVNHMMQHGNANFDRLLRNLIDSPHLLSGLRQVIANGKVFGSNVWSGAVNILSSFIHNEPTSYAVIAEAGLSKGFLEAITLTPIETPPAQNGTSPDLAMSNVADESATPNSSQLVRTLKIARSGEEALAKGILPATDAIVTIPQAFGAICLNNSGLELFLKSGALESFFEVFESPDHIKSMSSEVDLPRILGNSFDELVRHHPRLKSAVMSSVTVMLARVVHLCRQQAQKKGIGAKLWTEAENGDLHVSGGKQAVRGDSTIMQSVDGVENSDEDVGIREFNLSGSGQDANMGGTATKESDSITPTVSSYINVAAKFLSGFFENTALCAQFIETGGTEFILDFATLPSLPYDFNNQAASSEIARVVHLLVEQKPHLVLPSLVSRTLTTLDSLEPMMSHTDSSAFFSSFTSKSANSRSKARTDSLNISENAVNGTAVVKGLVNIHTLCIILSEAFSPPVFGSRPTHTSFSQVNLSDMWVTLVKSLGRLHKICVWEEILLQNSIPDGLKEATRIKGYGMGSEEADRVFGFIDRSLDSQARRSTSAADIAASSRSPSRMTLAMDGANGDTPIRSPISEDSAQFKNVQSIRYLLSQIPSSITPLFQGLGKALVPKRRLDSYLRQSAYMVAEALAEATLGQLEYKLPKDTSAAKDMYAYWIVILTSISQLMIESPMERPHPQCLTLALQAFKNHGGLAAINKLLETFFEEVKAVSADPEQLESTQDGASRLASAYGGIKIILTFYTQITSAKIIVDSTQTQGMSSTDRDPERPYFFSPNQFLVELRMAVLPIVRSIWNSEFVDKASSSILKCMVEILRTVLDGEHETGAFKRSDKPVTRGKSQFKSYNISSDRLSMLQSKDIDPELAREALYRCMNAREAAEEYCKAHMELARVPRMPIPTYDREKEKSPSRSPAARTPRRQDSDATVPDAETSSQSDQISLPSTASPNGQPSTIPDPPTEDAQTNEPASTSMPPPPPALEWPSDDSNTMTMSIDNLLNITDHSSLNPVNGTQTAILHEVPPTTPTKSVESIRLPDVVTIDDLEDERAAVRSNLIDRALDVLNVHADVTFELADLITTAAAKAPDAITMRREIGETLIQSLISFQGGEDLRPSGKKIASYANLLALVLQEKEFYDATLDELRGNLSYLLSFIKVPSEQAPDDASPWVGQILLVVEKLLAEDVQPHQIQWKPPNGDDSQAEDTIVEMEEPLVPFEEKSQLFDTILEILPRIGKDESLALSITRILVILTRNRKISTMLGEKKNLQRLFVMMKQLSNTHSDKLQSSFMLILRHIIEDDESIRQIMCKEIIANFETRPSRPTDTTGYVRQMYHLVLRSPGIFVEVTNEKLKLQKFDPNQKPQTLMLKPDVKPSVQLAGQNSNLHELLKYIGETPATPKETAKPSTEHTSNVEIITEKSKPQEIKAPVVEHPDGVVHFLLTQLLQFKDVEDKDPDPVGKDTPKEKSPSTLTIGDLLENPPGGALSASSGASITETETDKKADKPEFKAEQHPIYVYRCFLLQCLTELLAAYTRTKIEFINFSRKADPKAGTPSKPRSMIMKYLLEFLIPVGTIEHGESMAFRKKSNTSAWAMAAIVSLCLKTPEKAIDRSLEIPGEDQEPELLFVRKFVIEHALKAYKDAHVSTESLDVKYSRMLCIADLFNRLLIQSHKELAKIMFEKNFISALTGSIADIDLNFPGSKRTIKYILRPLKVLTQTAIELSESSLSTAPGQTDDDEISTASSVSDVDHAREETPDLFRHSTLGMLEPGREQESSSESSDEDEDMDEYGYEGDDGMDYEEEIERDGDEVVSDEDEDIEGPGHVEGLSGEVPMDVEVVIDGEEDEQSDEDDPDDSEDMDDGEDVEIIDEIGDDDDNDSLDDVDEGEWQDEDEEGEDFNGDNEVLDPETLVHEPTVREFVREIQNAGGETMFADLERDVENGNYMDDVTRHDDDDDEDDDDEDDLEDEEVMYDPEYDDDVASMPGPPFGWDTDDEPTMPTPRGHHHHHHHSRRISPWTLFPPGTDRGMLIPTYRNHRNPGVPRGTDDGTNPLLQRTGPAGTIGQPRSSRIGLNDAAATMSDWVHAINPRHQTEGAVSFINSIMAAVGSGGPSIGTIGGAHGALHFHVTGGQGHGPHVHLPRNLEAMIGLRRPMPEPVRSSRDDPLHISTFTPVSTMQRWQEEARLLFGTAYNEKTQRVINSLLKMLVPPIIEEERVRKQQEQEATEALRKKKEEEAKTLEEQRIAKEKADNEAQEQQEKEEREAAAALAVESETSVAQNPEPNEDTVNDGGDAMEGVESTQIEPPVDASEAIGDGQNATGEPVNETQRVRATFRGHEVDITGLGIDLEYLDALPDELREEVLMHQLAEQRSQAAAAGEEPTDISVEFLEALPPDIREELLQQEAQDRRRREREEQRRRNQANGGPAAARAEEMDPASFLASLDPHLRQAVLLEQDEEVLAQLPHGIAAEARALGGNRHMQRWGDIPRLNRSTGRLVREGRGPESDIKKPPRRQVIQMLDKAGVATLLRLLFVSQQGSARDTLNDILQNVSQNRQNRGEVVNMLLSILQDGSADVTAVERSFVSLSLRAKQPASQKTPQPLKRTLTGQTAGPLNAEMTPLMVIQQCLSALVHLTELNPHIPSFFLTEHETQSVLKGKASKKGKSRETKSSKYALNALLGLLDRKLIMENSSCMEQLSTLLQSITHPLTMLLRKDKDRHSDEAVEDKPAVDAIAPNTERASAPSEANGQVQDITMAETTPVAPEAQPDEVTATDSADLTSTIGEEASSTMQTTEKTDDANMANAKQSQKKQRNLTPPVVPEYNLRLVVTILAARECSAKTFRDTLSTINNLSAIPDAKEIFGNELIKQAQDLGVSISNDLDELVPQIQDADTGTDIQGMALAKFSPSSSDQAKLLRVLTALDYLFDPKRTGGTTAQGDDIAALDGSARDDLLTSLYENSTFGPLWTKLSDCLSALRQRENTINVATILLPLVEALMVVCKNTTLKDASTMKNLRDFAVTSPAPESRMENLFFRFTEDHRKILNDLVRHNPRLMSGTFSLLVKNPKVLEFDNKRNYFTRRLHSRGVEARHPQPPLQLSVRRDQVFLDSFKSLYFKSRDEMKYGKLSIRFHGEEGVDAGGVTREWFQVMSRQMFNADYALFIPVASDRTTFHPNKLSHINPEHLVFFKFIGRVIGKALYEGRALDCHFSRAVYKRILGKPVSIKDMETLDLDYYKSLLWTLENDISDIITESFSIETEAFGVPEIVDLVENGRNIPVTEENKQEYVQLVVEYRLTGSVRVQLEEFLKGFHDIVPAELIAIFNEQELELLISGLPDIDVDDWKNNTEYHNYSASSAQIQWFWRAVRSFDKEERAKLLQFVTGTSKVPLNGFKELEGMNGFSRFNIHRDYGNKDRLPSSHTCFNQLDLPEYESYEALRQQVHTAITAGSEYFGFA